MEPLKIGNIILPHRAVFGPMAGFTDAPCRRLMAQPFENRLRFFRHQQRIAVHGADKNPYFSHDLTPCLLLDSFILTAVVGKLNPFILREKSAPAEM